MDFLTLEDGTDAMSRNVGKGLPLDAADHPRTAQFSSASWRMPEVKNCIRILRIHYAETVEKGSWLEFRHWINAHLYLIRKGKAAPQACCFEVSQVARAWREYDFNQQETYPDDCTEPTPSPSSKRPSG
jgi:hypothetical protein